MTNPQPPQKLPDGSAPRLQISRGAYDYLWKLSEQIAARIYNDAQYLAEAHDLDTISPIHLKEAADHLMRGFAQPQPWKAWLDVIGGVLLGAGVSGLFTELTVTSSTEFNPLAITVYISAAFVGILLIAWAKWPRYR